MAQSDLERLRDDLLRFRAERDWEQFHTPRNLAASIVIEAAELLEHFQWQRDGELLSEARQAAASKELADVLIYLLLLSHELDVDLMAVAREKLAENAERFPIEEAKGRAWSNKPRLCEDAKGAETQGGPTMSEFDPSLAEGSVLTNEEVSQLFKCSTWGGMRRAHRTNTLVLIAKEAGAPYLDRWEGDVFHYTGMGMVGPQRLDATQNKTLAESDTNGVAVFLFENATPNEYHFVGRVTLARAPYPETQPDRDGNKRQVWVFPLKVRRIVSE